MFLLNWLLIGFSMRDIFTFYLNMDIRIGTG